MLKRTSFLPALVLVACSSPAKPPVTQPDPDPVAATPDAEPALAAADLCPRFLDRVRKSSATEKPEDIEKMQVILTDHCARWPESVQRCLATVPDADQGGCVDKLDPPARDAFMADLMTAFAGPPVCEQVTGESTAWVTLPATMDPEATAVAGRAYTEALNDSCRAGWSEDVIRCAGTTKDKPRSCLDAPGVDKSVGTTLDAQLARRTKLFTTAAAFKPTDKKIACAKVVAAHYGDKQWKGKLADVPAKDRKQAIKDSSTRLAAACKDDTWSSFVRGCVVAAKTEEERGWCLDAGRWGYPATASDAAAAGAGSSGDPAIECAAYMLKMDKYLACDKVPQESRDAARAGVDQMHQTIKDAATLPPDAQKQMADACKQGADALTAAATSVGCQL